MAVKLLGNTQNFVGLSTDTKPTEAPVGSTLYHLNTGEKFIWDGETWVDDLTLIYALSQAVR